MSCDDIDLLACLDGTGTDDDNGHVANCERCRHELRALEPQIALLMAYHRSTAACLLSADLVERAVAIPPEPGDITAHLQACPDCAAEWDRLLELAGRTDTVDAGPVPLPEELSRLIRNVGRTESKGRVIGRADRFGRRPSDPHILPAAAQPEDLTDTAEESESRASDEDQDPEE